ncbi:hypothetical protein BKA81DRAFT_408283 [Phyllosticta paracitricarpa]
MDAAIPFRPAGPARTSSVFSTTSFGKRTWGGRGSMLPHAWRHTLGIALLLVTVVLWTASNFLASTIFADNTYSKPYFVTYVNTAFFIIPLAPVLARQWKQDPTKIQALADVVKSGLKLRRSSPAEEERAEERERFLSPGGPSLEEDGLANSGRLLVGENDESEGRLTFMETARLSFEFCWLWFAANYFTAACLEHTTVASSTILTSTSSIWTLLCGAFIGVEQFTVRKLVGVLASLLGIVLISTVDISGTNNSDANRGTFPAKSGAEIALGDFLAFLSAVMYGFYAVLMKKRIGDESRVSMPLFFGLVGLFNVLLLWPGLVILHLTGIETFTMPPTARVLAIVLVNSTSSLVSDFCWAYSMLLTSPLIVTVGLSMTIPCSLIGQIFINGQTSNWIYWLGASVVLGSFVFINHEESKEEEQQQQQQPGDAATLAGDSVR